MRADMPRDWRPGCAQSFRATNGWRAVDPWKCGQAAGNHTSWHAWKGRHPAGHLADFGERRPFAVAKELCPASARLSAFFALSSSKSVSFCVTLGRIGPVQRFRVQNFGCRASQADGAAIEAALLAKGFASATEAAVADLVVLNTCSVTASADDDVRKAVHRAHRENPEARILVTGCYAQRAPEELALLPGVTWVVGNSHKIQIPDIVTEWDAHYDAHYHGEIHVGDIFAQHGFLSAPVEDAAGDRTRPNLKIQDGCNNRCSFCIIPFVRGRSRSAPAEQVVEQVHNLALRYREVVLSGINLGRWGREPGSSIRLADLVRVLLAETPIQRLRLSSVEPMDFSDDLLGLMASSPRIAKHVHAPLQSGSDTVLRRMHRQYW